MINTRQLESNVSAIANCATAIAVRVNGAIVWHHVYIANIIRAPAALFIILNGLTRNPFFATRSPLSDRLANGLGVSRGVSLARSAACPYAA
jgi:hypothetical protein